MNTSLDNTLINGASTLGISLDSVISQQMLDYLSLMVKWNKTHNLTAITDLTQMVMLHLLDSLSVLPYLTGQRIIDIGTGAGLPGMVLAMADPSRTYYLLDSAQKRTSFLNHVCHKLSLKNVVVINSRAEKYQSDIKFDVIISRAFSSLQLMVEYTSHLVDNEGYFLAMKGIYPQDEIDAVKDKVNLSRVIACDVPGVEAQRHLVLLQKNSV